MHKRTLCNVSPFFNAKFEGNFLEAREQVLELPDESIAVFKLFQLWVYTDSILTNNEIEGGVIASSLSGLYIFGEKYGIPDLQNLAIDIVIDQIEVTHEFSTKHLHKVYDDTPDTAPLRRLLVDYMACKCILTPSKLVEERRQEMPKDFLFDLIFAQYALRVGSKRHIVDFKACRSDYYVKPSAPTSRAAASEQE